MLRHVHDLVDQGKDWYKVSKHACSRIELIAWAIRVTDAGFVIGNKHKLAVATPDHVCVQGFAAAKEAALKFQRGHIRYAELTIVNAKERIQKLGGYASLEAMLKAESDTVIGDHGHG